MPNLSQFVANQVLGEVQTELEQAMNLHSSMHSLHEAHSIIEEEVDEFWDEVKLNPAKMTEDERVAWRRRIHKELVQVAAMATRAIVDLRLNISEHEQNYLKISFVEVPNPPGPKFF